MSRRGGARKDPARVRAAHKAAKRRRHENLVLVVGTLTEGAPKNFHTCGAPAKLEQREDRSWALFCAACEVFTT